MDNNTLKYIDIIKSKGKLLDSDNFSELYQINYYDGFLRIILYKHNDGTGYFNYCKYQENNSSKLVYTILWTPFSIREFCEKFLSDEIEIPEKFISFKELKKIKAKRICMSKSLPVWIDGNNLFYISNISNINKKHLDEWKRLSKNPEEALYIDYKFSNEFSYTKKWFESFEIFKSFISEEYYKRNENKNGYDIVIYDYNILKRGYEQIKNPMERKYILQLPYFNIDEKLKEYSIEQCAKKWKSITKHDVHTNFFVNTIKSYIKYKEKIMKG